MSDAIIIVENLGKKFRIRHQANGHRYTALRDVLAQKIKAPFGFLTNGKKNGESHPSTSEDFWALKDVSFEIKRGEVVGIIGRNGAGKSTLLKILSRITEPTAGRAKLYGRVASLLEVGTGFHPELTGRENIFLNGAILGMTNLEIRKKFDEIVAFAEVEKFLDTPVKRYSSGMYVRLAFAVAAHLEPEILIVDEVLAVGDAEFQRKCLGKMKDVSKQMGRTVLFVSHNLAAMGALCQKGIVLESGKVVHSADIDQCLSFYQSRRQTFRPQMGRSSGIAKYVDAYVVGSQNRSAATINSGEKLEIVFEIESKHPMDHVLPGVNVANTLGQRIATFWGGFTASRLRLNEGSNRFVLCIKGLDLSPGEYSLTATLGLDGETLDIVDDFLEVNVTAPASWSPARYPLPDHGPLFPEFQWTQI
ncbi:MAG TPA: ABC transporter ATP-binding protein [Candidatus Sulfotelmatobacter sp.]|nr:ABC transporter ATP-binding protein [Candidatus Sulfotelmatobacter sp.]